MAKLSRVTTGVCLLRRPKSCLIRWKQRRLRPADNKLLGVTKMLDTRLRPRPPFQGPDLPHASPRRRLRKTRSSWLTVPPGVHPRTRSTCTTAKFLNDKPLHLNVSRTDPTAVNIKKRLAATKLVGPRIRSTGPIDIASAARIARPHLLDLTPVRMCTSQWSNIHLATKAHPLA